MQNRCHGSKKTGHIIKEYNTSHGKVTLFRGRHFKLDKYRWEVIEFGSYGVACRLDGTEEGYVWPYEKVAEWVAQYEVEYLGSGHA